VRAQGQLLKPEEFANIVVRLNPDGSTVRLGDIARIELGALTYTQLARYNGKPAAILGVFQTPGRTRSRSRRASGQRWKI